MAPFLFDKYKKYGIFPIMKTINIEILGETMTIETNGKGSGRILSGLCRETNMTMEDCAFNTGLDIIEAMALAHACHGVDVESKEYICGIEEAYEALGNNLDY